MAAVTICSDFGIPKNKVCQCFHCFPIYWPWSDGTGCMIFLFWCWVLNQLFHSPVSSSSRGSFVPLHFCHKCGVICILRLLIFLPAVLLPTCDSSSLAFHSVYSVYKLNKQGDNIQPLCAPFLRLDHLNWSIFKSTDCFFYQFRFVLQPS